jgi:transcriptional regulator with XRE-family HTH domain
MTSEKEDGVVMLATVHGVRHDDKTVSAPCTARGAIDSDMRDSIAKRLRHARVTAGYATAADAARAFTWNTNTYTSAENGNRDPSRSAAERYAKAFRVSLDWLVSGSGQMKPGVWGVSLVGYVGAKAEVFPIEDQELDVIDVPFQVSPSCVAFIVRGDSMWPRYEEGVILIGEEAFDVMSLVHKRAIVHLSDGRRFVKTLALGSAPGLFTLLSERYSPIHDVEIERAWRIRGTVEK